MYEVVTLAQLMERFPMEWVFLLDPQKNESDQLVGGKLVYHDKDRDEVVRRAMELPSPKHIAVRFMGPALPFGRAIL
jgi:hypothetical protein